MGHGSAFIRRCVNRCVLTWVERPNPAQVSLIGNRVKTTGVGGPRGYDSGKKIKGRKRHLLVDTQGFVLKVKVHPADIMDRDGLMLLVDGARERRSRN